jgi:hypothetical protein
VASDAEGQVPPSRFVRPSPYIFENAFMKIFSLENVFLVLSLKKVKKKKKNLTPYISKIYTLERQNN